LALSLLWVLAGTAPASAAFLGANPRLGESFLGKGIGPAAGDVSRELPPASGGSCLERPAECFVAPAAEPPNVRTLNPVADPARPVYEQGHAGQIVEDHVLSREIADQQGRLPEALDPSNIEPKPYEMNARKGGYEGQYLQDRQALIDGGLTPGQADEVMQETLDWIMNDALPRPMDPRVLDTIPSPGSKN
jgi:hypothetical protein